MSKQDKLLNRFLTKPKDFTYDELKTLLGGFGYSELTGGSGSRVAFINKDTAHIIRLHKPHPGRILKRYQLDLIREELQENEVLP